jgi:LysM repeat protein
MKKALSRIVIPCALVAVLVAVGAPVSAAPERAHKGQGTGSTIHVVQWGESVALIARRYGVSMWAIVQANGLRNPNFIYAGQRLVIPTGAAPSPPPGQTSTYVVQRGDTLAIVAARFGTTVTQLVHLNGLWNPNFIYVGQVLKVPGGAPPAQPPAAPPSDCTYVVKPGDTLTRIALQHHTTMWAMAIANNLANPSFIWVGQRLVIPGCSQGAAPAPTPTPAPPPPAPAPAPSGGRPKGVIIVIWDGTQRGHLLEMLNSGQLPNLSGFIRENQPLTWPVIKSQTCRPGSEAGYMTETGPANSAISTGLGYAGMANWTNAEPHRIPDGLTLWEWFKRRGYATGFVSSKDKPFWPSVTLDNARREIDYWRVAEQPQSWVTDNALTFVRAHAGSRFFLWIHYKEPDTLGHGYGENSAEYSQALVIDDQEFGRLVGELRAQGIMGDTLLILTTDHGFNEGGTQHDTCTPDTKDLFLAVNDTARGMSGCVRYQTDITPCIWAYYR